MPQNPVLDGLVQRWLSGDDHAATELLEHLHRDLLRVVRNRFHPMLRGRLDPEDVVQSALRTFFRRLRKKNLPGTTADDVRRVLVTIAKRKLAQKIRFHFAGIRDVRREARRRQDSGTNPPEPVSPRDAQEAELHEFLRWLEDVMPQLGPREQEVLKLALQGYSTADMAAELGLSQRTVQLCLRGLVIKLTQLARADV